MFLRRLFFSAFTFFLVFSTTSVFAQEEVPSVLAKNVLVIDLTTGKTIFEKAPQEKVPVASLTKLMVSLLALEKVPSEQIVTISPKASETLGSTSQINAGEQMTIANLLFGLLIPSGNDAAVALAEHLAGTEAGFVFLMNQRAAELGLINTHYGNVTGFDLNGGYSSASDLSAIAQKLLTHDLFRQAIRSQNINLTTQHGVDHFVLNTNQILGTTISGLTVTGMKTGTTLEAGECLMILAQNESGKEVLITLLGSTDRYLDARNLLAWNSENFELGATPTYIPKINPTISLPAWPFADISSYEPFFESISQLKTKGIIQGDDLTGLLRGEDDLNRAELVTILLRAHGYETPEEIAACKDTGNFSGSAFSDVSIEVWYANSIHCAASLGWVTGDDLPAEAPPGLLPTFRPGDGVNLPEALKLIVEAETGLPSSAFSGPNWYDVYFNALLAGNLIEKDNQKEEYFFTHNDYSLGMIQSPISRTASFELLYRLSESKIEEDGTFSYQSSLTAEEYIEKGTMLDMQEGDLVVNDPHLGFILSNLPIGQFEISDLRFNIQNPSGVNSDYYTTWTIIYPTGDQKGEELFRLFIYDPDYFAALKSSSEAQDFSFENTFRFEFSCAKNLSGDSQITSLYLYICPGGEIAEGVVIW